MKHALVVFAHPCTESFGAAVHAATLAGLTKGGWSIDDCNLYPEAFDPVLSAAERRGYHDTTTNTAPVQPYVDRLRAAEALVLVFPVWNFGFPAILKGFVDRVFLPGVSFRLEEGRVTPALSNIRRLAAVTTYGASRWTAMLMGDPPRRVVTRVLRAVCRPDRLRYMALHDMNRATDGMRRDYLGRVEAAMERL